LLLSIIWAKLENLTKEMGNVEHRATDAAGAVAELKAELDGFRAELSTRVAGEVEGIIPDFKPASKVRTSASESLATDRHAPSQERGMANEGAFSGDQSKRISSVPRQVTPAGADVPLQSCEQLGSMKASQADNFSRGGSSSSEALWQRQKVPRPRTSNVQLPPRPTDCSSFRRVPDESSLRTSEAPSPSHAPMAQSSSARDTGDHKPSNASTANRREMSVEKIKETPKSWWRPGSCLSRSEKKPAR